MKTFHKIIIIGAGAAGLMAAITAAREGSDDIVILEANMEAGRKITATGNGKCNFTNRYCDNNCFRSDSDKVMKYISRFTPDDAVSFFLDIGVKAYERNGYLYPKSEQAKSVRDALEYQVFKNGAKIIYGCKVTDIITSARDINNGSISNFIITCNNGDTYECEKLLVACGGAAAPVFGTDGSIYGILDKIGLNVIRPMPALCGLKTSDVFLKQLDGVRTHARVYYIYDRDITTPCFSEYGEIIFNKNGISGIPVLNASRYVIKNLYLGNAPVLYIDFFPEEDEKTLFAYLKKIIISQNMPLCKSLCGIMNDKLLRTVLSLSGFVPEAKLHYNNEGEIDSGLFRLVALLKCFRLHISGDCGFENAQTTQGGLSLTEINENCESLKYNNLFFAGEILDTDGKCGGYNLQWAWSTGYISGLGLGNTK